MRTVKALSTASWVILLISALLLVNVSMAQRSNTLIDSQWRFEKSDPAGAEGTSFDDSSWELLDLPHTYNAQDGQDGGSNYYRGPAWYRKTVNIPSGDSGKRIFLFFESVAKAADVYVNGTFVGRHEGAYAAFCFDVTDQVNFGADNLIAVKANNSSAIEIIPLSGDFTQWGGICRSVRLLKTDPVHITLLDYASPGVYLTPTNVSASSAGLEVKTKVRNESGSAANVTIRTILKDAADTTVETLTTTQSVGAGAEQDFIQNTTVSNPHLWNGLADPYLYQAIVEVEVDSVVVDSIEQPLGFRYYSVNPDQGLLLNGQYYDLHGVAIHEDREDKGRAISDADREQDISLMLEMGCTWIRLSHYQHAEKIYDLADESGLVIYTEIPYVNGTSTATAFKDNAKQQLRELIRQNYNHPAVFFWGLYNEIGVNTDFQNLVTELNTLAHQEDATRPTTAATNQGTSNAINWIPDTISWNKYLGWYGGNASDIAGWADGIHASQPNDEIGVSEYGAGASIHHHEEYPAKPSTTGSWHPEEYQSYFHEVHWKAFKTRPFLWCKTIWNGFDFGADNRSEGDRNGINDKGMVIRDRTVKKDAFYWYKANWTTDPMVHITSRRFTPRDRCPQYVKVYSNCDTVELFVNGLSKGVKTSSDHIFLWEEAIGLNVGDNEIRAVGVSGGNDYTDTCNWERTAPALPNPIYTVASVTASASESGNPPENTIDGSLSTRWAANGDGQWIKFDLDAVQDVNEIGIAFYNGDSRVYTFDLDYSNDDTNWTPVLTGATSDGTTFGIEKFDLGSVISARYFRITGHGSTSSTAGSWNSYYEVEFYDSDAIAIIDCAYIRSLNCGYDYDLSGPAGDPDCRIDFYDFAEVVAGWLAEPVIATFEAEDAEHTGTAVNANGAVYVDYPDVESSGDYVRWTLTVPSIAGAGVYTLEFRYANATSYDRPLEIKVNDSVASPSLSFPSTGSWATWGISSLDASLVVGSNTVQATTIGIRGPNMDYLHLPGLAGLEQTSYGFDDLIGFCLRWLDCNNPEDPLCN